MVAPAPVLASVDEAKSDELPAVAEKQIIFCVDVSGSMCVSQQIDAKHAFFKLKGTAAPRSATR